MKVFLKFDLNEEREEYQDCMNGPKYKGQLDEIWDRLFRQYWKHGYNNTTLNTLLEDEKCQLLMDELIREYKSLAKDWEYK